MADELKKEKWTNYLAVSTVLIAVCATLSTFKGGGYSTRSLLSQAKASDQWSYYQSKSIKGYLYEIEKDNLELQLHHLKEEDAKTVETRIEFYSQKIKKYEEEKAKITAEATKFEKERDDAKLHSQSFGLAVIFLQVSILLSSIAALTKRKMLWYISMAGGAVGVVYFINGFLLFFPA